MVGSLIAHYKLLRMVGSGGMGSVYEAVDEKTSDRVAIKLLRPELTSNREALTRFINEARATSLIAHPSLVKIFESGILPSGEAYLVMEFLDGEMLSSRIRRHQGPVPEMEVRLIGWQLASALAGAHEKGIVHRGSKPREKTVQFFPRPSLIMGEA
jgi:serine/threonine-protein kinase